MDGARLPHALDPGRLSRLINGTTRRYAAETRPGIHCRHLHVFRNSEEQQLFYRGTPQGFQTFDLGNEEIVILTSIGGIIWWTEDTGFGLSTRALNRHDPSNPSRPMAWFCTTINGRRREVVIQDGQSPPIRITEDGGYSRFDQRERKTVGGVSGYRNLPIGTSMAFVQGRLFVLDRDGMSWNYGGINGGASDIYTFAPSVLLTGGSFRVPDSRIGPNVHALMAAPWLNGADDFGQLFIGSQNGILAQRVVDPETSWQEQDVLRTKTRPHGPSGHRAWTEVMGDIWFRGHNRSKQTGGIFSIRKSESEFYSQWGDTAESEEAGVWLDRDTDWLLDHASLTVHNNYLLCTVAPELSGNAVRHRGLVVMDLAGISRIGQSEGPVWEGLWTGAYPVQISGRWMLCRDNDGRNQFYELTRDADYDLDNQGRACPIEMQQELASLPHRYLFEDKILEGARVQATHIRRRTEFEFSFRPSPSDPWTLWHKTVKHPVIDPCVIPGDEACADIKRTDGNEMIHLPMAKFECQSASLQPSRRFTDLQMRIKVTGHAAITRERRTARVDPQSDRVQCEDQPPTLRAALPAPLNYSHDINARKFAP